MKDRLWFLIHRTFTLVVSIGILLSPSANAQENASTTSVHAAPVAPIKQGTTMPHPVIPVWQDINSRYTSSELFQKIMTLANLGRLAPQEVEETFGVKFMPPRADKGVGLIYTAEGDTTRYGSAFWFSHKENGISWTLGLHGLSIGRSKKECIRFQDVLKTILEMGWEEERLYPIIHANYVDFQYWKRTDGMTSRLNIGNRLLMKEDSCLGGIQFSNSPR